MIYKKNIIVLLIIFLLLASRSFKYSVNFALVLLLTAFFISVLLVVKLDFLALSIKQKYKLLLFITGVGNFNRLYIEINHYINCSS